MYFIKNNNSMLVYNGVISPVGMDISPNSAVYGYPLHK